MLYSVSLKRNRDFRRLYGKGKSAAAPSAVLYCRRNGTGENRLGVTVGAKLGCAVRRNRVRRRLREIYRTNEARFLRGRDIVLVARVRAAHCSYRSLERDVLSLAGRLGLLRGEERA